MKVWNCRFRAWNVRRQWSTPELHRCVSRRVTISEGWNIRRRRRRRRSAVGELEPGFTRASTVGGAALHRSTGCVAWRAALVYRCPGNGCQLARCYDARRWCGREPAAETRVFVADLSAVRNHLICQMCEISTRCASADVRLSGSNSFVHRLLVYFRSPSILMCLSVTYSVQNSKFSSSRQHYSSPKSVYSFKSLVSSSHFILLKVSY